MNLSRLYQHYIPFKYRVFTLPIVTLLIIVVLSLTVGKYMVDSIFSTREELDGLAQKTQTLQAKNNLLSTVDKQQIKAEAEAVVTAVPSQTPSLPSLATIRSLVAQRGLTLTTFAVSEGAESKQGTRSVMMDISLYGGLEAVVGFSNDIKNYSPLMKISNANISLGAGSDASGRFTIVSAWAPLPQSLGKAETPLDPIKNNEQQIIDQLKSLKIAETIRVSSSSATAAIPNPNRVNPFEF
jgi:Tfp pilus assembly protein PilO